MSKFSDSGHQSVTLTPVWVSPPCMTGHLPADFMSFPSMVFLLLVAVLRRPVRPGRFESSSQIAGGTAGIGHVRWRAVPRRAACNDPPIAGIILTNHRD